MDDIFQVLIYLFIIISFLASLFRKKEKPQTKSEPTYRPAPQQKAETKVPQQDEYDILQEIERMFKTEIPSPQKSEEKSYGTEEETEVIAEHTKTEEWRQPTQLEHRTTISEHTPENWDTRIKKSEEKKAIVNKKILQQAETFEKLLARREEERYGLQKDIRRRLKEPATLKEYVIISEIIGKPKALQE